MNEKILQITITRLDEDWLKVITQNETRIVSSAVTTPLATLELIGKLIDNLEPLK